MENIMREILFRGKTTPKCNSEEFNNIWVEGDLIHSVDLCYIHPIGNHVKVQGELGKLIVMHEIDPTTLGRYTGLTDKNGTKIFEGDIVSKKDEVYGRVFGTVCFGKYATINGDQETHVGFYIDWSKSKDDLLRRDIGFWTKRCEVIGNIHDTPELLNEC